MRNCPGPGEKDLGPPPGRAHQGGSSRSGPSYVSQSEAINSIMQITMDTTPYANLETDAIVSYVFDDTDPIQGTLAEIDNSANGLLKKLVTGAEFSGKPLEMTLIHAPSRTHSRSPAARRSREARQVRRRRPPQNRRSRHPLPQVPLDQKVRLPGPRKRSQRRLRSSHRRRRCHGRFRNRQIQVRQKDRQGRRIDFDPRLFRLQQIHRRKGSQARPDHRRLPKLRPRPDQRAFE